MEATLKKITLCKPRNDLTAVEQSDLARLGKPNKRGPGPSQWWLPPHWLPGGQLLTLLLYLGLTPYYVFVLKVGLFCLLSLNIRCQLQYSVAQLFSRRSVYLCLINSVSLNSIIIYVVKILLSSSSSFPQVRDISSKSELKHSI